MNPFFAYLIKSSVSLALFYIVFKLTVSRDKMHSVNRFVLLGILIVSAFIPFADIPLIQETQVIPKVEIFREFVAQPVFNVAPVLGSIQSASETKSFDVNPYMVFYILIILMLFIRLLISTIRVMQIIRSAEKRPFRKIVLAVVKDFIQPFTFLNKVVISEKDFTKNREIIVTHEYAHIKYLHAIDLMVCTLFTALHWFNPFMWFLRRDLKLIHEFQADQAVLNRGIDVKKYQLLVLEKSVGERRFAMANYFSQKPILKRLEMMKKKTKNHWKGVKLILFIPMILLLLQAFANPEMIAKKVGDIVPSIVQEDSSKIWLDNWTIENLNNINGGLLIEEVEVAPPPPSYPQSNLPKYDKKKHGVQIPMTNTLPILINSKNMILAANTKVNEDELLNGIENFLKGTPPFETVKKGPEQVEKNLPFVGDVKISKGVITIRHDTGSKKEFVQGLLRSIGEKHLEARDNISKEYFGINYFSLSSDKRNVIDKMVPIRVFIVKPHVTKNDKLVKPPPPENKLIADTLSITIIADGNLETTIKNVQEFIKKYGGEHLIVNILAKEGVSDKEVDQVKEVLRKAGVTKINIITEEQSVIRVGENWLNVDGKKVEISALSKLIKEHMNQHGSLSTVELQIRDDVSKERILKINNELNKIVGLKVLRKDFTPPLPPPPPPRIIILLEKDGVITVDKKKSSFDELEKILIKRNKSMEGLSKYYGVNYYQVVRVNVEIGCADEHFKKAKEVLRKSKITHVEYSTDYKESEWKETTKN